MASKIAFTNGNGGVTPHIRTIRVLACETSSSLSCAENLAQYGTVIERHKAYLPRTGRVQAVNVDQSCHPNGKDVYTINGKI